jgi:hypothetical protein
MLSTLPMLLRNGIHSCQQTTPKNPQGNYICERMHQAIGNTLRALSLLNPPAGIEDAHLQLDTAIANAV